MNAKVIALLVIAPNLKQFQYPPTGGWIKLVVYSYHEIVLCDKMEWTTSHNTDASEKQLADQKKPETKQ